MRSNNLKNNNNFIENNQGKISTLLLCVFIVAIMAVGFYYIMRQGVNSENHVTSAPDEEINVVLPTRPEQKKAWNELTLDEKYQRIYEEYGIEVPRKDFDVVDIQNTVNEDAYAWLYVPDTNVDVPVLQHPTEDDYYLYYNPDHTRGLPGGIFTEGSVNSKNFDDRITIIYGHNMKNKTGFGSLHNYESEEFYNEHPYIFIYLPNDLRVYQIFAAYDGPDYHLIKGVNWCDDSYLEYLKNTQQYDGPNDHHTEGVSFKPTDKILTLCTCVPGVYHKRFLIQAKLLE